MPFCGYNVKMVKGLTVFAEGLFSATLERAKEKRIDIHQAFKEEVTDLKVFLEALERRYQAAKRSRSGHSIRVMTDVAKWVHEKDRPGRRQGPKSKA